MEMIFMRRMISFLLLVVFCLSLACPAFAAVHSPGEHGPVHRPSFGGDNPKTGDIIMMWVIIMVVALAALILLLVIYRKKMRK